MNEESSTFEVDITNIDDVVFNMFQSLFNPYKMVKTFTAESMDEQQISLDIDSKENLHHGPYNDYQLNITISGQTFIENDPDKEQFNVLAGYMGKQLQSINIDDVNIYITNAVGYLLDDCTVQDDGYTHIVRYHVRLFVNDL